jgi:hypothetical protein
MRIVFVAAMAILPGLPAPAFAQAAGAARSADCRDDNGVDRCAGAQQARTRALYGVAPVEQLDAEGTQLIRAFFVNGFGGDEAHVAFARPRGGDPEMIVTVPDSDPAKRIGMRAAVPLATWNRLLARARYFDRDLAPLPTDKNEVPLCLHSWVVTVEAAGPRQGMRGGVRRKTQDACGEGMAVDLAFEMADAAVELLPPCALLNPEQHRNAVARLGACAQLGGDRVAAALAMNQFNSNWFRNPKQGMAMFIAYLFYDQAEMEWSGEPIVRGGIASAAAWVDHMQNRHFRVARAIGETPDRVRIEANLQDRSSEKSNEWQRADAVQIWTRENGFGFRLRSMKAEPFRPRP